MPRPPTPWEALGEFIRQQRRLADLSLRQLAEVAKVSSAYLSQIERGLYKPSAAVVKQIADALGVSVETLYSQVGWLDPDYRHAAEAPSVEEAIRLDRRLSAHQKDALLHVYRSMVDA